MRSLKFQLFKAAFYASLAILAIGCGVRKKTAKTDLAVSQYAKRSKDFKSNRQLVTSFYGDVLKGSFAADTNDLDSGVFESNGIKIKFKAKSKNGKPVVDFAAEAKPVARSSLTENEQTKETEKQTSELKLQSQTELKTRSWPWWCYPLMFIAGLAVLARVFKKLKTWIKNRV